MSAGGADVTTPEEPQGAGRSLQEEMQGKAEVPLPPTWGGRYFEPQAAEACGQHALCRKARLAKIQNHSLPICKERFTVFMSLDTLFVNDFP